MYKTDCNILEYFSILARHAVSERIRTLLLCYVVSYYRWCLDREAAEALRRKKLEKLLKILTPPNLTYAKLCKAGIPGGDGVVFYLRRTMKLPMIVHESSEEEWRFAKFMTEGYIRDKNGLPLRPDGETEVAFEELFDRFVCRGSKLTELHKCVLDMNSEERAKEAVRTGLIHSENREACIRYAKKQGDWRTLPVLLFLDVREPEQDEKEEEREEGWTEGYKS